MAALLSGCKSLPRRAAVVLLIARLRIEPPTVPFWTFQIGKRKKKKPRFKVFLNSCKYVKLFLDYGVSRGLGMPFLISLIIQGGTRCIGSVDASEEAFVEARGDKRLIAAPVCWHQSTAKIKITSSRAGSPQHWSAGRVGPDPDPTRPSHGSDDLYIGVA
ncbi:hypothetical protein B0H14DRAFT_2558846 [Mycena olivaceomarginata]|nr:hypothetical protein B0H14DRAFT_2558846 [Mycena olivaceomarginata]